MDKDLKEEAEEQIYKEVHFGFDTKEQIYEGIIEMFYDEEEIDEKWIEMEVEKQYNEHQIESKKWKYPTDFERLEKVFYELNRNGIIAIHKAGYTKQDGYDDVDEILEQLRKNEIKTSGYCFYHTQDLERAIFPEIGNLYLAFDSHNQNDKEAINIGNKIVELLEKYEFQVEWNKSINTRILITKINWQKKPDHEDWSLNRSIKIITEKQTNYTKKWWKFW